MKLLITMFLFAAAQTGLAKTVTFTQLDLDKDGYLSLTEVKDNDLLASFEVADIDADGRLSKNEFIQFRSQANNQMKVKDVAKKGEHAKAKKMEADKAEM
tara:strand:- start:86 stop:385 length:300 start_codon:yes stop_codon:yes gene_type:complete